MENIFFLSCMLQLINASLAFIQKSNTSSVNHKTSFHLVSILSLSPLSLSMDSAIESFFILKSSLVIISSSNRSVNFFNLISSLLIVLSMFSCIASLFSISVS